MYCYAMDLFCMNLSVLAHTSMYLYNQVFTGTYKYVLYLMTQE